MDDLLWPTVGRLRSRTWGEHCKTGLRPLSQDLLDLTHGCSLGNGTVIRYSWSSRESCSGLLWDLTFIPEVTGSKVWLGSSSLKRGWMSSLPTPPLPSHRYSHSSPSVSTRWEESSESGDGTFVYEVRVGRGGTREGVGKSRPSFGQEIQKVARTNILVVLKQRIET